MPVPAGPTEVTTQWLSEALALTFAGVTIETAEATRIGEAYGLASQIFRCRWRSRGAVQSVVVKLWNTDGPAGVNEVLFYGAFGRSAGARIPACYHAAVDEETERGVLVLEDLGDVVQGDCLQQLSRDGAQAVARSLAGLHATWLEQPATPREAAMIEVGLQRAQQAVGSGPGKTRPSLPSLMAALRPGRPGR